MGIEPIIVLYTRRQAMTSPPSATLPSKYAMKPRPWKGEPSSTPPYKHGACSPPAEIVGHT